MSTRMIRTDKVTYDLLNQRKKVIEQTYKRLRGKPMKRVSFSKIIRHAFSQPLFSDIDIIRMGEKRC